MKKNALKDVVVAASCLFVVGQASIASAHSTGAQSLTAGAKKTDTFTITCSNEEGGTTPTFRVSARVKDNAPVKTPILRVTLSKAGLTSVFAEDTVADGDTKWSPYVYLSGPVGSNGNGVYTMTITKKAGTGTAAENYIADAHCEGPASSGYIHTGTTITGPSPNQ